MDLSRRLATAATLLLIAGCGAASPSSAAQTGTVAGLVEFRACGGPPVDSPKPCIFRPMADARVELVAGNQIITSTVSDTDGRYSVSVPPGTYSVHVVIAQGVSRTEDSRTINVEPGQRVVADFQLTFHAA